MSDGEHALARTVFGSDRLSASKIFNVDGWIVLVTGGGTGLGLITAGALAENGAKVYITGRRLEPLEEAAKTAAPKGGKGAIIPLQADMSKKEDIDKVKETIISKEKWLNALINNHGVAITPPKIDEAEQTAEGLSKFMYNEEKFDNWLDAYRINTASYYFTSFAFLPLLAAAKSVGNYSEPGNIINVASISGMTVTSQGGQFSYNSNKGATIALTRMLATELARRELGIRVNMICPGVFPSGMTGYTEDATQPSKEFKDKTGIPLGRTGNAIDYAQTVFSLLSNQYITGRELVVDGGYLLNQV
ncbi:short-chain dehydrogenase [Cryptococcus neoformans]|uniref:Short-chain dehydrogenase n=2 Tax=Cryptococcus neoformans TaxID=5207 RepID=A0A854QI62_CRYNE|nr:short-chain dehydrogenase [Cryptococcus neoformans var. grubii H99]AUB23534.1 short-chain dehydrogenase [Cryptococcus neoformans var. grubii]OWT41134.1 short-chain dehydrogenase [Cryptococcus neoformans var. grubii Bt1]OWZ34516.1 short-chain dehydrogenase [Cryptococcus neoformans var. grubii AD2-60a]OWZ46600.1 short-chain dehydrogenase [Cryptococcus neoformans var. grubii C23]OWZ55722.1 short-chain dehydrogenase [Cryptococcus neoformans var. grubii 125.91]OWZ79759.1 short-chain dehydrogena|eukprot:XP_012048106.1 short-chain dehydrogenase [Cryptococcus neoformans var. grubii H99]